MAIVQISRITQRKGLNINLPQLAGAEFGWSIDTRQLYIGNGTLAEGAPVIGNTEILTEFSDILAFNTTYTYKGQAAGYTVQTGPTTGDPVTQSLQSWFDQWATVKDFGAVGDGVTDDTDAINRALYQLYCREVNPQIRRALFFPAGVYKIQETIIIPPYATLYGEGADNSVILLDSTSDASTLNAYVARTGDSLQQTGTNIGTNGATPPTFITCINMGFATADLTPSIFLVDRANNCKFQNVTFTGPFAKADLTTDSALMAGIEFDSSASLICNQIVFDTCVFSGLSYGVATEEQIQGIVIQNSNFDTLYQGIILGVSAPINGGPTGVRIMNNKFDNIYAEGIKLGNIQSNATGYNMFYDVGDHFAGIASPQTNCILFQGNNNVSLGDMYARSVNFYATYPPISISDTASIAFTGGRGTQYGTYSRLSGLSFTLVDNASSQIIESFPVSIARNRTINYCIVRNTTVRTGTFTVVANGTISWSDNYDENASTGITLSAALVGSNINFIYSATSTGFNGTIQYSTTQFF